MGKYDYQNNMEDALNSMDNYKVISGGTIQTIYGRSQGWLYYKKGKEKIKRQTLRRTTRQIKVENHTVLISDRNGIQRNIGQDNVIYL